MKPFRLSSLALVSALCLSGAMVGSASATSVDHNNPPQSLVVEHAEILLSPTDDNKLEGYLAIWNGTQIQANLTAITSDVFDSGEIYRNVFGKIETVRGGVFIPGHAELKMSGSGVYLVLQEPTLPLNQIEKVVLILDFEGGTQLSVPARIVRRGEELTDHRHGEGDAVSR